MAWYTDAATRRMKKPRLEDFSSEGHVDPYAWFATPTQQPRKETLMNGAGTRRIAAGLGLTLAILTTACAAVGSAGQGAGSQTLAMSIAAPSDSAQVATPF